MGPHQFSGMPECVCMCLHMFRVFACLRAFTWIELLDQSVCNCTSVFAVGMNKLHIYFSREHVCSCLEQCLTFHIHVPVLFAFQHLLSTCISTCTHSNWVCIALDVCFFLQLNLHDHWKSWRRWPVCSRHSLVKFFRYLPIQVRKFLQTDSNVMYTITEKISDPFSHLGQGKSRIWWHNLLNVTWQHERTQWEIGKQ